VKDLRNTSWKEQRKIACTQGVVFEAHILGGWRVEPRGFHPHTPIIFGVVTWALNSIWNRQNIIQTLVKLKFQCWKVRSPHSGIFDVFRHRDLRFCYDLSGTLHKGRPHCLQHSASEMSAGWGHLTPEGLYPHRKICCPNYSRGQVKVFSWVLSVAITLRTLLVSNWLTGASLDYLECRYILYFTLHS
jgi:hypothetical protein